MALISYISHLDIAAFKEAIKRAAKVNKLPSKMSPILKISPISVALFISVIVARIFLRQQSLLLIMMTTV